MKTIETAPSTCIVYFYALYWPVCKAMYIGQTNCIERRLSQHTANLQNYSWSKDIVAQYGMPSFHVFSFTAVATEACQNPVQFEQRYYDFFRTRGWTMLNPVPPCKTNFAHARTGAQCTANRHAHQIAAIKVFSKPEMQVKLRHAQQQRFEKPGSHEVASNALHTRYSNVERRKEAEQSQHVRFAKQTERDKVSRNSKAWHANPDNAAKHAKAMSKQQKLRWQFQKTYGTSTVWHSKYGEPNWPAWLNFIVLADDTVIAFVWDTREVKYVGKDRPMNYVRAIDSHKPLIDNNNLLTNICKYGN